MGSEILSGEGHQVVTVDDGGQALTYLRENRPDLILADTEMPVAGGYDLCEFVRSRSDLQDVKVVLLQPPLQEYDRLRAEEAGTDAVLHKPLDAAALIETVTSLLGLNGAERPARPTAFQPPALPSFAIRAPAPAAVAPVHPADPFAEAVAEALAESGSAEPLRQQIHDAATEILEAAVPSLAARITDRILRRIQKGS